jgi:uncharacterized protein (DUF2236 family)
VLRHVHEQRAVGLLYGQRALAIGALNPLNFIGTRNHTWARATPFKRLSHTAKLFETIFFGSRAEADEVLAFVRRAHAPVHGELAEDAGQTKAGTPYSAYDPELMLWTVAVSADSARSFYELLVGKLSEAERDSFWADYVRFGELFGMPREVAPRSHAEFAAYFEEQLTRPEAYLTDEARYVGSAVMLEIPVPAAQRAGMPIHNLLMVGSLPPAVREMYGFKWSAAKAAGFRAAVAALRGARPITPRRVRCGWNTRHFDLVAKTERSRIERGEHVPGSLPEGMKLSEVLADRQAAA